MVCIPAVEQMMIKSLVACYSGRSPLYVKHDFGRRAASGGSLWFDFLCSLTAGLAWRTMERSHGLSVGSESCPAIIIHLPPELHFSLALGNYTLPFGQVD